MFQIGDYVVCGSKGVCEIEKKTTLDLSGVDKTREYFILKPIYQRASTVYIPLDTAEESMRYCLSKDEAMKLIDSLPEVEVLDISNDKYAESMYKEAIKNDGCIGEVRVLKTILDRIERRARMGRRETSVDGRYLHQVQDGLYGELAISLSCDKDAVEELIEGKLKEQMVF